ncbi:MAG: hypothetical protein IPI55_03540 [Flavobacteriales bacterium]|nr:hypothetical protein [Flavobacteriales bacterium]
MIARVIIAGTMVSATLLACTRAEAQTPVHSASSPTPVQLLTNELCGCFSAIDLAAKDNVIDAHVKRCMENAIVHHPGAVRTLIQQQSKQNTVGFDLGRTLGSLLDKSCAAYQKVKNRLRPGRAEAGVRNSDS